MEKIISLLTRISELYNIPQWAVNSGAIAICIILLAFPFIARFLMRPKYHKFREMILFKVLWRWKYKKGDIVGLWCYCPKCQVMLMCDDENCRSAEALQDKITYFICHECGGNELGRVVGGDRRYVLSLVRREIWRHIREGSYNEVASATKEALQIYVELEAAKAQNNTQMATVLEEKVESLEAVIEEGGAMEQHEAAHEVLDEALGVAETEEGASTIPASTKEEAPVSQEERSSQEGEAVVHADEMAVKKDGI